MKKNVLMLLLLIFVLVTMAACKKSDETSERQSQKIQVSDEAVSGETNEFKSNEKDSKETDETDAQAGESKESVTRLEIDEKNNDKDKDQTDETFRADDSGTASRPGKYPNKDADEDETDESESEEDTRLILPWEESEDAKQPKDYTWEEYEALSFAQQAMFQNHLGEDGFVTWLNKVQNPTGKYPWEEAGAKQPKDYTWKEYEALTNFQQIAFRNHLGETAFEQWLDKAQNKTEKNPWEVAGAKQPKDYTWNEYEKLTLSQQMAFQKSLGEKGFEAWFEKVTKKTEKNPWETAGAKQPKDYTYAEFEKLTLNQQMAFQKALGEKGFKDWMDKVQKQEQEQTTKNPWEAAGAKQPKDYTWKEFEALTLAQQMAFQDVLGEAGFESWLNKVQNQTEKNPWETAGAKQPKDYTYAEFEALTLAQQMAFQKALGEAGFEQWLNKVLNQGQESTEANPWEAAGAKQPKDYTYAEFEALSMGQQMAFQKALGEAGFEQWLNKVQNQEPTETNPWEVAGAKQPKDYTWDEFNELSMGQQMAFQKHLGESGFEEWLNKNQP